MKFFVVFEVPRILSKHLSISTCITLGNLVFINLVSIFFLCVIYCHSKVFMVQTTRLFNLI
jgi:hypothetical protein